MEKRSGQDLQETPLVSVCLPAYNAEETLAKTLDSILAQDYKNLEIIVCDNHSTDQTAKIAKAYAKLGVRYLLSPDSVAKEPLCPGESNWNYILGQATGPYLALYHADDLYAPDMVRKQVEFLQHNPTVSSVFTMTQMIDELDRPIRRGSTSLPDEYKDKSTFNFAELFNASLKYGNIIITPTLMTRKETLTSVGDFNYREFFTAADLALWLRMSQWRPIGIINEPLHKYRVSANKTSSLANKSRSNIAHYFLVMDYYLNKEKTKRLVQKGALNTYTTYKCSDQVFCAVNLIMKGKMSEAKKVLDKALKWDALHPLSSKPRHFLQIIYGWLLKATFLLGLENTMGRLGHLVYTDYRAKKTKPL